MISFSSSVPPFHIPHLVEHPHTKCGIYPHTHIQLVITRVTLRFRLRWHGDSTDAPRRQPRAQISSGATKKGEKPTRMGFEPTRAEHIGLAVQRLNHSATSSPRRTNLLLPFFNVCARTVASGERVSSPFLFALVSFYRTAGHTCMRVAGVWSWYTVCRLRKRSAMLGDASNFAVARDWRILESRALTEIYSYLPPGKLAWRFDWCFGYKTHVY